MRALTEADLLSAGRTLDNQGLADAFERQRRKRRYAYLAWLCLGSHYLYLDRRRTQLLFWLTLGGLFIWWIADLFRIPAMVERGNRRAVADLLTSWQLQMERRLQPMPPPAPAAVWSAPASPPPEPVRPSVSDTLPPLHIGPVTHRRPRRLRTAPAAVLAAALVAIVALAIFSPRHVYPRSTVEPAFRTVRQVNVRASPSTASAIRASIAGNVTVRGEIEASEGPSQWLRITRGAHSGRYVALHNLERR